MENIKIIVDDEGKEHVIQTTDTGIISMPKSVWDELEAAKEAQSL